jgi:4-hydroxybenzoate polyprenyltransferase
MGTSKAKKLLLKFFSLFSAVRGYNILVLIVAQYLVAIFIFSPTKSLTKVLFDVHLLFVVLASVFVIAGGYIINNFYDVKADKINRPLKASFDNYIKQSTKLKLYFFLNFIGFSFGILISFRAAFFFASYIFAIWFYSHKLKQYPFLGVLSATVLTVLPFFAVFVYFGNFHKIIFVYASFLFLVIMVRQLIKDLQNMKGAIANNYNTFPLVYGEKKTKELAVLVLLFTSIPIAILFSTPAESFVQYYFYFAILVLLFVGFYLWQSKTTKEYQILHNILKLLLLIGVLCLLFSDTSVLLDKVINRLN